MSYPIHTAKHKLPSMLTAEAMLASRRIEEGFHHLETVIFCMHPAMLKFFSWKFPSRRVNGFLGDLYLPYKAKGRVAVMGNFGVGAPVTVVLAEEMAALGTRRIVLLGSAGGLQPEMQTGQVVICDRAIRDEGTSYHYLPEGKYVDASSGLVSVLAERMTKNGVDYSIGVTWSTDAPYRETREEATQFQKEGVMTVDMESAGLFAMGQIRGLETASVLVIGDSLANRGWSAPPDIRILHQRLKSILRLLIEL